MAGQGKNKKGITSKLGKDGSAGEKIHEKAKNAKKEKQKVYLPIHLVKPEEEEMTEYEITYKDRLLAVEIEKLAAKGLTNDQIIAAIGISRTTFYHRMKDPYFVYILHKHRGIANQEVENALYKAATGFKTTEKTTEAKPIKDSETGEIRYELMTAKVVEKEIAPDTNAAKFFLANRNPEEWKMKVEPMQSAGADMSNIKFSIKRRGE